MKCTIISLVLFVIVLAEVGPVHCDYSDNLDSTTSDLNDGPKSVRNRRFLPVLSKQPNKIYQECITPAGSKGHCKHVQHCSLAEFKQNFWRFLNYLCIIETFSIGVCCPDDISDKASAIQLPENGEESPIWSEDNDIESSDRAPEAIISRPEERGWYDINENQTFVKTYFSRKGCGLVTKSFPKITGGHPAGEWPWMAALLLPGRAKSFCGGVLITDRHLITAAHCTFKYTAEEIFVRLGEYDFATYNETRFRDFRVVDIRQHIDFDGTTYENDIAILKLQRATLFNSYIWPVCMPPSGETWESYQGVVAGWGSQFFGGPVSDILMEVVVPIWTNKRCKEAFAQRITDSVICAGATEGGRDSCQGDSGGPMVVQLPNKRWVVVGIVSWGIKCGEPNHPGIYTRINSFSQWIIENSIF